MISERARPLPAASKSLEDEDARVVYRQVVLSYDRTAGFDYFNQHSSELDNCAPTFSILIVYMKTRGDELRMNFPRTSAQHTRTASL
jgi:hypothetical protein